MNEAIMFFLLQYARHFEGTKLMHTFGKDVITYIFLIFLDWTSPDESG